MFRILGAFNSIEKIQEKYKNNQGPHVYSIPCWQWFPITRSPTAPKDAEAVQQCVVDRVNQYIADRAQEEHTILEEAADDKADERYQKSLELNEKIETLSEFLDAKPEEEIDTTGDISRDMEVRNQRYAVVSIIADPDPNDEPLICFTRFFDTKEEAIDYNRNTLHQANVVTDCYVVDMYEWCNVLLTKTKKFVETVPAAYSYSELEELHRGRVWEKTMINKILEDQKRTKQIEQAVEDAGDEPIEEDGGGVEESKSGE